MIYKVIKNSDDGTLRKGDTIYFEENGDLMCIEAGGWINADDVKKVLKGAEYKPDINLIKNKIKSLKQSIKKLENIIYDE